MFKVGSFFAGIGGICLAFQQAGFELAWANEVNASACATYRNNFKHTLFEGDICKLNPSQVEKVDVLTGGFPCQAFSIAGHRKGFDDPRGRLFFEMLRFVDAFTPRVLFFENVRLFKTHNAGNTYRIVKAELEDRGYYIHDNVLNTCEYSKLPQHRERFYMVCFKHRADFEKFTILGWPKRTDITQRIPFKDIIENEVGDIHYFKRFPHYYNLAIHLVDDHESFYQWRRVYFRKNKSKVCPTLTANMGSGGHNVPLVMDSKDLRRLTPTECLRLQGFDTEKFHFPPNMSFGNQYKQIGNSVSIPVVHAIAQKIMSSIDKTF